jgi:hypothetical protein
MRTPERESPIGLLYKAETPPGRLTNRNRTPTVISEAELDELFDRFEKGLDAAEAWVAKEGLRLETR